MRMIKDLIVYTRYTAHEYLIGVGYYVKMGTMDWIEEIGKVVSQTDDSKVRIKRVMECNGHRIYGVSNVIKRYEAKKNSY